MWIVLNDAFSRYVYSICGNMSNLLLVLRALITPSAHAAGTPPVEPAEVFTISSEDGESGSMHTDSYQMVVSKRGLTAWSGDKSSGLGPIVH